MSARKDPLAVTGAHHIELRVPSIGSTIVEVPDGPDRICLVIGSREFSIKGVPFNGVFMEVVPAWIDHAIEALERAKELYQKHGDPNPRNPRTRIDFNDLPNVLHATKSMSK